MKQKTTVFALTAVSVALLSACGSPRTPGAANPPATPLPAVHAVNGGAVDADQSKAIGSLIEATSVGDLTIQTPPKHVFTAKTLTPDNYDAAMNAIKNSHGADVQNLAKLDGVAAYELDNKAGTLYLRDPNVAGLKHSAIGHVFDQTGAKDGYVSIGVRSAPDNTATVKADYSGALIGTYDGSSEVVADVAAKLDWSPTVKTLAVNVTNAHVSNDNMSGTYSPLAAKTELDFDRTMIWDPSTARFVLKDSVGETRAHLYGSDQKELGGTFDHMVGGKAYSGAFFGTKQP